MDTEILLSLFFFLCALFSLIYLRFSATDQMISVSVYCLLNANDRNVHFNLRTLTFHRCSAPNVHIISNARRYKIQAYEIYGQTFNALEIIIWSDCRLKHECKRERKKRRDFISRSESIRSVEVCFASSIFFHNGGNVWSDTMGSINKLKTLSPQAPSAQ